MFLMVLLVSSEEVCLQFYGNCHFGYVSKIHNNMTLGRFTVILMSSGAQKRSHTQV